MKNENYNSLENSSPLKQLQSWDLLQIIPLSVKLVP